MIDHGRSIQDFLGVGCRSGMLERRWEAHLCAFIYVPAAPCGKVNGGSAASERRLVHAITRVKQSGSPHGSKIPLHEAVSEGLPYGH
jgi:hypothetical protein